MRRSLSLMESLWRENYPPPERLYHGTDPLRASLIVAENMIRANDPIDPIAAASVSTTTEEWVAEDHAVDYARVAYGHPIGFVFCLDGTKVAAAFSMQSFASEHASIDEFEYRVLADIRPLNRYLRGIALVGDPGLLNDPGFRRRLYADLQESTAGPAVFTSYREFSAALGTLRHRRR